MLGKKCNLSPYNGTESIYNNCLIKSIKLLLEKNWRCQQKKLNKVLADVKGT